ncbi:hypothetical protein MUK42_13538 [Musa troglodytarum]|uniref:PHD finger protein ALFIN-LIKE n=1 Tax=Musa troglodytarum TaxID=320322 RepID=A0A9E7LBH4_9LILI|nr:hypothetical protein MUK42_13538 [Musa troglodytarum]
MDRKGQGQPITSWTIHMIFRDFLGIRAGLIKAHYWSFFSSPFFLEVLAGLVVLDPFPCSCCFTVTACFLLGGGAADYEKFHQQCDPQKPYMCLYGCPNETWELKEPPDGPHELPEPNIGVNFARDGMPEKDWLAHVAIHSDAWLYSYAFYCISIYSCIMNYGIVPNGGLSTQMQLFDMINSNLAIYEIVCGTANTVTPQKKSPLQLQEGEFVYHHLSGFMRACLQ